MFDKLFDIIIQIWDSLKPWEIIPHYDRGVKLRFGKPILNKDGSVKILDPGIHFKIPFFEEILTIMVKTTTISLREQTITTKDNICIVVKAVIKYEIKNPDIILLEVNDALDAICDMTQGIIRNTFVTSDYKDCNGDILGKSIKEKAKKEVEKWGVRIQDVTITDLGRMTSLRLLNSPYGAN